jgi:hypothetical protein
LSASLEDDPIDFERLRNLKRQYIAHILDTLIEGGGRADFKQILEKVPNAPKSTLSNNIDSLVQLGVITQKGSRGPFELRYKTPFCFLTEPSKVPDAYLGLLGKKGTTPIDEPETQSAVEKLHQEGFEFSKIFVCTTQEALGSWSGYFKDAIQRRLEIIPVNIDEMNDIEKMESRIKQNFIELLRNYLLVMDCTSGTRPSGIAFYRLALKYSVPLIYLYEEKGEMFWLISKHDAMNEID